MDSANQYHLWCIMKEGKERQPRIPVGWTSRFVTDEPWVNGGQRTSSKQRGLEPNCPHGHRDWDDCPVCCH